MTPEQILWVVGIVLYLFVLVGLRRRREGIRHNMGSIARAVVGGVFMFLVSSQFESMRGAAPLIGIGFAALLFVGKRPRSRAIPQQVRRNVINRWELETGKKFNPRSYELDHITPFSQSGSHTEDNLQVIPRGANRAKGAKSPWWDVLGRR